MSGRVSAASVVAVIASVSAAGAAVPPPTTLVAWDRLIAAREASIASAPDALPAFNRNVVLAGGMDVQRLEPGIEADGATVQRWRGAVLLRGVGLDVVLRSLATSLPAQRDVIAARFTRRTGDRLGVYLRLVRHAGITVTYDTDHDVIINRLSPVMATSRSVMTRVNEVTGAGTADERVLSRDEDHGFLWRLNAYWWYAETPAGVMAVMESLTLSRDIPTLLRPVAAPVVRRIARESVTSALSGLRDRFGPSS